MLIITKLLLHIPGLDCLWWLLLAMLLPLLLGLLLGYWLWYQYKKRVGEIEAERDALKAKFTTLETDYVSLKYKYDEMQKDNNALRSSLHLAEADIAILKLKLQKATAPEAEAPVARGLVGAVAGKQEIDYAALFSPGNLQVIEGIGPKVEKVLKDAGVVDWGVLAKKSPVDLTAILGAAGTAFAMMDPKSWPQQAALAHDGKWDELVKFQKFLDAGREDQGDFENPSKMEQMALRLLDKMKGGDSAKARGMAGGVDYTGVFTADNLQVIEGIGPKIEELLHKAGFNDWKGLAAATPEQLSKILEDAGPNFRIHDPKSWPQQAALARDGKWDELVEYQKFLDTGREDKGDFETASKAEKMAAKVLGFASAKPEDLKIVEGIGPKIEELLKNAGIKNWSDLAGASVDELKEILADAGDRYRLANPSTWPRQAELAAAGKWKDLKEYQNYLEGGKDPNAG